MTALAADSAVQGCRESRAEWMICTRSLGTGIGAPDSKYSAFGAAWRCVDWRI
jgi:hypothetical protein